MKKFRVSHGLSCHTEFERSILEIMYQKCTYFLELNTKKPIEDFVA